MNHDKLITISYINSKSKLYIKWLNNVYSFSLSFRYLYFPFCIINCITLFSTYFEIEVCTGRN